MSQLMDEILRKVGQLPESERRELVSILNSKTDAIDQGPAVRAAQAEFARSIRGKYAHVLTSSDTFNRRKHADTELENRRTSSPIRRKQ